MNCKIQDLIIVHYSIAFFFILGLMYDHVAAHLVQPDFLPNGIPFWREGRRTSLSPFRKLKMVHNANPYLGTSFGCLIRDSPLGRGESRRVTPDTTARRRGYRPRRPHRPRVAAEGVVCARSPRDTEGPTFENARSTHL